MRECRRRCWHSCRRCDRLADKHDTLKKRGRGRWWPLLGGIKKDVHAHTQRHRQSPSIHQTWPDRAVPSSNANRQSTQFASRPFAVPGNGTNQSHLLHDSPSSERSSQSKTYQRGRGTIGFIRWLPDTTIPYLITLPVLGNAVRLVKNVLPTSELVRTALWRRTRLVLIFTRIAVLLVVWLIKRVKMSIKLVAFGDSA